jgi:transcriptional regulator with XRE-family HTH domain
MEQSIGARLKQAREQRRLTLQQVSETTKVRPHYLQALENDDLSAISSAAQARGFLRIYADFLGLDTTELIPVRGASEPAPISQSSVSAPDSSSALDQETVSKSKPERSGLLGNLLNRFRRRTEKETPIPARIPDVATPVEIPAPPEPKPFIPARVTEELPAVPESPVIEPVMEPKTVNPEATPAIDSTPTVKVARKTASRPRKPSAGLDKQNDEKKKVGG